MPVQPSAWFPGPLSPQQLNEDLYSYNGTGYGANGILWHSHELLMHEQMTACRSLPVSTAGTWSTFLGTSTAAFNMIDTGALFGVGSEFPGPFATYQFVANAVAASGYFRQPGDVAPVAGLATAFPEGAGGIYLASHFATANTATTTPAALGAGMEYNTGNVTVFNAQGAIQSHSTQSQGSAYYLDLINAGGGAYGTLPSATATQQIAALYLPLGNGYVVDWAVTVAVTASSSDANNFKMILGLSTIATSTNSGALGTYIQTPATVNSTGEFLYIFSGTTNPTTGATYSASMYGPGIPSIGNAYVWEPAGFYADGSASSTTPPCNNADTSGFTPRHTWVWKSVSQQGTLPFANANPYLSNGLTTGWTTLNGSIAAVTPPGNPPPQPNGVLLTASGSGTASHAISGPFPATPGQQYQIYTDFFMPGGAYDGDIGVDWYDGSGNFLSQVNATPLVSVPAKAWVPFSLWATAPTSAATGRPWAGLNSGGGSIPGTQQTYIAGIVAVGPTPSPQGSWAGMPVTSTLMNGQNGPRQSLGLLNNPPALRCAQSLATSLSNTTPTAITFTADPAFLPGIDTFNAYHNTTGTYIVPLSGLYLAFTTFPFSANTTGARYSGFKVVSTVGTTNFEGPAYPAVSTSGGITSACAFRVLDLQANDTVSALAYQNSGGSLGLTGANNYLSRFGMLFMSPLPSSGISSATPPVTSFHWFAGVSPGSLGTYLNQHLGNDLNFLVNRPYFTGYQSTAQTGFTNATWNVVNIDTPSGIVYGSPGDSYGGWNSSTNAYIAQQPGWYMVMSEVFAVLPGLTTGFVSAGIKCSSSGGVVPLTSPDQYQTMYFPLTTGPLPGAAAVGCYYLQPGEFVQPMIKVTGWTAGTWGTAVQANPKVNSQFSVLWIAE